MLVEVVEPLGSEVIVHGSLAGAEPAAQVVVSTAYGPITARLEPGARPPVGAPVRLVFDPAAAHVFDAATGAPLRRT
jgi:ABC-type sugar transport system ATPase subunit